MLSVLGISWWQALGLLVAWFVLAAVGLAIIHVGTGWEDDI